MVSVRGNWGEEAECCKHGVEHDSQTGGIRYNLITRLQTDRRWFMPQPWCIDDDPTYPATGKMISQPPFLLVLQSSTSFSLFLNLSSITFHAFFSPHRPLLQPQQHNSTPTYHSHLFTAPPELFPSASQSCLQENSKRERRGIQLELPTDGVI